MECFNCNRPLDEDVDTIITDRDGDSYCEDCAGDCLSFCEECDEWVAPDDIRSIDGDRRYVCGRCACRNYYLCESCGEWTSSDYGDRDITLCSSCYEESYFTCRECERVLSNDCYYEDGYCEECHEEMMGGIHDYSYKPDLNFQETETEDNACPLAYLGFELEAGGLDSRSDCKEIAEALIDRDGEATFYLKNDSSIPEYGFELVSHPITLRRHKELPWADVLSHMSGEGMRSHDLGESSCGLHVHVSRDYLSNNKWLLVDWLVNKYQDEFERIARRTETHWARFKKCDGRPLSEVYGKENGRYQAVNFSNHCTVEFRLFRGTLRYSAFMATLEIVDALVQWAKCTSIGDILACRDAFRSLTKYIMTNSELYNNAIEYLKTLNLMKDNN